MRQHTKALTMQQERRGMWIGVVAVPLVALWLLGGPAGMMLSAVHAHMTGVVLSLLLPGFGAVITLQYLVKWFMS